MAPQTRKSSARAAKKFPSLISCDLAFLAKSVVIFLHARAQRVARRFFPHLRFHILGETFDDLRLAEQSSIHSGTGSSGACQKPGVLGFQPAFNTEQMVAEIGPVAWFHLLWSFAREVAFFPQILRIRLLVPTSKPLHIVIHSLICSTLTAICGPRLSPKNHVSVEMAHARGFAHHSGRYDVFAHRAYLCAV